jgi:hypothetical protein
MSLIGLLSLLQLPLLLNLLLLYLLLKFLSLTLQLFFKEPVFFLLAMLLCLMVCLAFFSELLDGGFGSGSRG